MGRGVYLLSCALVLLRASITAGSAPHESLADSLDFVDENGARSLEEALADQQQTRRWQLRWRARGAALSPGALNLYERVIWQPSSRTEWGLVVERDPGEPSWTDFSAGYGRIDLPLRGLDAVAGDLLPGWASGMVCARSAGMGGLPLSQPAADSERMEYRSSSENRALRGVAVRGRAGRARWTALAGRSWRDARVNDAGQAVSLPQSGYHVSATQIKGRDRFRMDVLAGRWQLREERWSAGVSVLSARFGRSLDLRRPERKPWAFHGDHLGLGAVDGMVRLGRLKIRGEAALSDGGHTGMVAGARGRVAGVRWRMLLRHYAPGFTSFFGGAPSRGGMENERGAMICVAGRGWELFADRYRRPRRTYYYPLAATVVSLGGRVSRRCRNATTATLRVRVDRRPYWRENRSVEQQSQLLRLDLGHQRRHGWLTLVRLRLQGKRVGRRPGGAESGWAAGVLWKADWQPFSLVLHGTRYLTESYASALYGYEYDLPGMVSVRPLHLDGWRGYGMVHLRCGWMTLSARYRCEHRDGVRHYFGVQLELSGDRKRFP